MDLLDNIGFGIYFIIFFGKIIEVTISTLRRVLISRGERLKGSIIAFFDILIWLIITSTVLTGLHEDPLRILVFVAAFGIGTYLGCSLEEKLAFGLSSMIVVAPDSERSENLATILRDNGFGVTVMTGNGRDGKRYLLKLYLKRKQVNTVKDLINSNSEKAVVVVNDLKKIRGAYNLRK